jgi:hypothetical protein
MDRTATAASLRQVSDEENIKFAAIEDGGEYHDTMKNWLGNENFRPWLYPEYTLITPGRSVRCFRKLPLLGKLRTWH